MVDVDTLRSVEWLNCGWSTDQSWFNFRDGQAIILFSKPINRLWANRTERFVNFLHRPKSADE